MSICSQNKFGLIENLKLSKLTITYIFASVPHTVVSSSAANFTAKKIATRIVAV